MGCLPANRPEMVKKMETKEIDGYKVTLYKYGKYRVEGKDGKWLEEQLDDEVDFDNLSECWEMIQHEIHDQHPEYYREYFGY